MPVLYSCDICGKHIERLDSIQIFGSDKIGIICENCWRPIEKQLTEKEVADVNER